MPLRSQSCALLRAGKAPNNEMNSATLILFLCLGASEVAVAAPSVQAPTIDGQQIATQICAACHGLNGNSVSTYFPLLAQQSEAYLYDQLKQFAAQGERRASGVMGAMAVDLTDPEMRALAFYFSHQSLAIPARSYAPWPAQGESIYLSGIPERHVAACASCHGMRAEGLPDTFPRLAGQYAQYVLTQLRDFRSGARQSDPDRMMHNLTVKLTVAEMQAVSEYVSRLP